jgi:hypothetical protein
MGTPIDRFTALTDITFVASPPNRARLELGVDFASMTMPVIATSAVTCGTTVQQSITIEHNSKITSEQIASIVRNIFRNDDTLTIEHG